MPRRVRARAVSVRYLFPQHDVADDVENDDDDDGDDDEAPRLLSLLLLLIMIIEVVALIFAHMRATLCPPPSPSLHLSLSCSLYIHIYLWYMCVIWSSWKISTHKNILAAATAPQLLFRPLPLLLPLCCCRRHCEQDGLPVSCFRLSKFFTFFNASTHTHTAAARHMYVEAFLYRTCCCSCCCCWC